MDKFGHVSCHNKGHGASCIYAYTIDQGKGCRQQRGGYPLVQDQRGDGGIGVKKHIGKGKEHHHGSPNLDQESCLGGFLGRRNFRRSTCRLILPRSIECQSYEVGGNDRGIV